MGWARDARRAQVAYYRLLAASPHAATWTVGTGFAVATGLWSNTENGVAASDANADEVAAAIDRFRELDAPATWLGADDPLAELLVAAGCRADEDGIDMGARIDELDLSEQAVGVEIRVAGDERQLAQALGLMARHGLLDERGRDRAQRLYASAGARLVHLLALDGDSLVGTASAFYDDDVVLLQHVLVDPAARRRGIGLALALARLREGRDRGCTTAILAPTPQSRGLYEPLGFTVTPMERVFYLPLGT
jgi:GNAT superfamily N-acetyltransferase